jgi:hypothetical protein
MSKLIRNIWRVLKLHHKGWRKCEFCGIWTRRIFSIPYIEAGFLVCKKCDIEDLNQNKDDYGKEN